MNAKRTRILLSLAVLSWSAVLLYFHASGRIVKYLAPDFRTICLVGGLGLAVLGLFTLLTAGEEADDCEHGSTTDLHPLTAFLLMTVPLLCALLWTKDEYSSAALARKGLYDAPAPGATAVLAVNRAPLTREDLEKGHRRTPDGFLEFNLIEIFLATGDREQQALLDGMKIATEGRVIEERNNPAGTRKRLYRLFVTCCAADSRAIPIVLEFGKTPPPLSDNGWVRASGTLRFPLENGLLQPVLEVERAEPLETPSEESFQRQ